VDHVAGIVRASIAAALAVVAACGGSSGAMDVGDAAAADGRAAGPDGGDSSVDPLAELDVCEDGVAALLRATETTLPRANTNGYVAPTAARLEAVRRSIGALLSGDARQALTDARIAGYGLCRAGAVALSRPLVATEGAASFAWRTSGARPVIVEAPHPLSDLLTLGQAVDLFESLNARAIVTSGSHRCANDSASPCSGTTDACSTGTSQSFRESDMAHVDGSFFQVAHVALAEHAADDLVVAVHGSADPGVSLSDGSTFATTANSPVARLAAELVTRFQGSPLAAEPITTCNSYPGAPAVDERLCGTTDVQGRHLNGSANACAAAATAASGRFLHMEQSRAVRDQPTIVAAALDAVVLP
jgi:hypothetical protein